MSEVAVLARRAGEIFDDPASAVLFAEYASECGNPVLGRIAPQRDMYEALEIAGFGECFGAYMDGRLCGMAFLLMSPVPHYGEKLQLATVESLFVAAAARSTGLGRLLMETVEAHATEAGCAAILYSAPVGSQFAKLLFLSGHCTHTNEVFCRRLG